MARAIHKRSSRADRAFIGVNCAQYPVVDCVRAIRHEKGAFTGATQRRLGRFESANGGTIFLDEVGDLPADIQIALLRVLQNVKSSASAQETDSGGCADTCSHSPRLDCARRRRKISPRSPVSVNVVPIKNAFTTRRKDEFRCWSIFHWPLWNRVGKKSGQSIRNARIQDYSWAGQYQRASERD